METSAGSECHGERKSGEPALSSLGVSASAPPGLFPQGSFATVGAVQVGTVPWVRNSLKKGADFSSISEFDCINSHAQGKMDNIIEAKELQIERKHFYVELRENDRGKFLRITEEAHGRRNSIIVPSTGIDDFTAIIAEVLTNGETAPA
jgi:hypothetical protein